MRPTTSTLNAAAAAFERAVAHKVTLDNTKSGNPDLFDITGMVTKWHISRIANTDLPPQARMSTGYIAAQLTGTVKGKVTPDVGSIDGAKMWSPYSSGGIASGGVGALITNGIRVKAGMTTTAGLELQPRFTGYTDDLRVHSVAKNADFTAYDGNYRLTTPVVLPVMGNSYLTSVTSPRVGIRPNLYATTVMDFALRQNGYYASPPPRANCVLSVPAHGSLYAEPGYGALSVRSPCIEEPTSSSETDDGAMVTYAATGGLCGGPLGDNGLSGVAPSLVPVPTGTAAAPTDIKALYDPQSGATYANTFAANQNVCIETWVRVGTPFPMGYAASQPGWGIRFFQVPSGGSPTSYHLLSAGVRVDGTPYISVGTGFTLATGTAPGINGWINLRIMIVNGAGSTTTARFYINNQAVQTLVVSAAAGSGAGGSSGTWQAQLCTNRTAQTIATSTGVILPFEGLQITQEGFTGAPSNFGFHPTAYLDQSLSPLVVSPHSDTARPAQQLITDLTTAEYGMGQFDEVGEFYFFNRKRWTRAPGNTSQLTVQSINALNDMDIDQTASGVYNQFTVDYQPYGIQLHGQVYQNSKLVGCHSGGSFVYLIHLPFPVLGLDVGSYLPGGGYDGQIFPLPAGPYAFSGFRCSWWPDGKKPTGSGLTDPPSNVQVYLNIIDDETLKLTVVNGESNPVYLVSGSDQAAGTRGQNAIILFGRAVTVNDTSNGDNSGQQTSYFTDDATSIGLYGARPLELSAANEWCQSLAVATTVGDDMKGFLKDLHPTIENVIIKAHPGLQQGDRITLNDADGTLFASNMVVVGNEEDYDMQPNAAGNGYTMALSGRLGV